MPLPSSGAISLSQVNTELGLSSTATISMNDSAVRNLFGVGGSGTSISMSQGYGKANQFAFTISSNQTNADLRTLAVNAGWNGTSKVVATVASGVWISSNSTGVAALSVSGSFPNGIQLTNNGNIVGMGGAGGKGGGGNGTTVIAGSGGGGGGTGLSVSTAITITNNGIIAGGGGGGGGGQGQTWTDGYGPWTVASGGGGGGGRSSLAANSSGGSRGDGAYLGGDGGAGTSSSAGGGGARNYQGSHFFSGAGGGGGGWGAGGSTGDTGNSNLRPAGWPVGPYGGGGGGAAVSGNGNISWVSTGTRYGAIA